MNDIIINYTTLSLSQQVLERQQSHADQIAGYLPANADIGDSTGMLLSMFDPLSKLAVEIGADASRALAGIERTMATAVGDTAVIMRDEDVRVADVARVQIERLGGTGPSGYPELSGPTLGAADNSAPGDYGNVDSYYPEKIMSMVGNVGDAAGNANGLVSEVGQWTSRQTVTEVDDASSYLVPGSAPDNFVQDLRWSAGVLLGGIDWVAEKFIGFSILDRCVFHPLAGDWQGIYRASEAWGHAGDAAQAVARNHAGLVAATPQGWQGESGNAFRTAMTSLTGACLGLSTAYSTASSYVKTISTVCKLACVGIGKGLELSANKLIKMAAEAATPVVGWAIGAATAYSDIQAVVSQVRLIYTIIETVISAIQDFVQAKTSIVDSLAIIEDLSQGLVGSVAN